MLCHFYHIFVWYTTKPSVFWPSVCDWLVVYSIWNNRIDEQIHRPHSLNGIYIFRCLNLFIWRKHCKHFYSHKEQRIHKMKKKLRMQKNETGIRNAWETFGYHLNTGVDVYRRIKYFIATVEVWANEITKQREKNRE